MYLFPRGVSSALKHRIKGYQLIMTKYVVKRVLLAILTIFVVATITFFLMHGVPGGPFVSEKSISAEAQAALNAKFGMDKPIGVQYKNYMAGVLQGDFSFSLKQRGWTVSDIIATKFPVSAKIGGMAVLLALVIGVPLGCIAAMNRGKFWDNLIIVLATCGIAFPSFVICTVGMYLFGVQLGWLPTFGLAGPANYVLPVFALSFYPMAYITRLMRSSMLDVVGQDYMRTARAKGLSQGKCLFKHALRNAVLPVVTYVGPMLAYTLVGSFVVEKIFVSPGLGGQFVSSITNRDYTVIMGTTIFLATLVICMNVIVDIVYKIIDPRIELK
jgi:oligopeptide transport system permease protein